MSVALQALLVAERVTTRGRVPLEALIDLEAATGRVCELTIPDGSVHLAVVPASLDVLAGCVLTTDTALAVTLGTPAQNQPLLLQAGGAYALLGTDLEASAALSVTYTPGTGVPAHVVILLAGR